LVGGIRALDFDVLGKQTKRQSISHVSFLPLCCRKHTQNRNI